MDSGYCIAGKFNNKSFITKIDSLGQVTSIQDHFDQFAQTILYPNPSSDGYYKFKCPYEIIKVEIIDLAGKEIQIVNYEHNYDEGSFNLNVAAGMYLVTFHYKNGCKHVIRLLRE